MLPSSQGDKTTSGFEGGGAVNIEEAVAVWEAEYTELVRMMRTYNGDQYKTGFTDGLETAVDALRIYLNEAKGL